jgi:hypothetical protein
MRTIWTKSGNAINIKTAKEASMSTMIQYEYLVKEDRQLEAALLLVENLVQFKEDIEILREMSAEEFGAFMADWMAGEDESA